MSGTDLLAQRLHNQRIAGRRFTAPEDVVRWLGAVQAQDYSSAKWALAQRTSAITDAAVDTTVAAGAILRTHVMRPTWHFVLPADIRWMLELTAPRVNIACRSYYRKMELNDAIFSRSQAVIGRALRGGKHLTRAQLSQALQDAGVTSPRDDKLRVVFIMLRAELDGIVCSGPWSGRQSTYALLDERVPPARRLDREEALSELANRYFTSHAPATIRDFMWWSGLTSREARTALESIRSSLGSDEIDAKTYWRPKRRPRAVASSGEAHLLTTYDECLVAYRDRAPLERRQAEQIMRDNGQTVALGGRFAATWKRTVTSEGVLLRVTPFASFDRREKDALDAAAKRYERFLNMRVTLSGI